MFNIFCGGVITGFAISEMLSGNFAPILPLVIIVALNIWVGLYEVEKKEEIKCLICSQ